MPVDEPLPSFDRPPVVETVLGVQYERLPAVTSAHLGVFWGRLAADWPQVRQGARVQHVQEEFGAGRRRKPMQLMFSQTATSRLILKNAQEDRLIQVQDDGLHYNGLGGDDRPYPSYRMVRPEFDEMYDRLARFFLEFGLGELKPLQWEVTYVNRLPHGTVWESPADWSGLFQGIPGLARAPGGIDLESFGGHWHFCIRPERGRLHVEIQHTEDDALLMKLTARGAPRVGETIDLGAGLDLGHRTIVRAFRNLTSTDAHRFWGMRA